MPVLTALQNRKHATGALATLDVPRREHIFNTSPNRHLLALLLRLAGHAAELCLHFEKIAQSQQQEPDNRHRAARWRDLSLRFKSRIRRLMRADFLIGLRPGKPDTAALMAISRHPTYSHFDRIARHVLSPRVALGDDADKFLGLRPTYEIYEYWCFFTLADALRQAFPEVSWKSNIALLPGNLLLDLQHGSSLSGKLGELALAVIFQNKYGRKLDHDGLFSISKTCIPDMVLKLHKGDSLRTIIFDAKYRSGWSSIHEALSDMHVYRDAIRIGSNQPAIEAAFILTPAHQSELDRYYMPEYRTKFGFGGFDLSPRQSTQVEELIKVLRSFVCQHEGF